MPGGRNFLTFPAAKGAEAAAAYRGEGSLGMSERGSTDDGRLESIYNLMPKPKEEKEYLGHVKREIRAENEMVEEFVREQMGISSSTEDEALELPRQEQEELVDQLKAKWDNVNARYQQLIHQTFFEHGRLKAKARLEGELDEIEAYIAKLTRGPVTVVP